MRSTLAQLKMGQGPVGDHRGQRTVASTCRKRNPTRPSPIFRKRGEENLQLLSWCSDPAGAGRSLGVLVVQNKAHRKYREDEVEALENRPSMVLAEMIATGELKQITRPGLELDLRRPVTIEGVMAYGDEMGLGHVILPRAADPLVTGLLNDDSDSELKRLEEALGSLRGLDPTICCRAATVSDGRRTTGPCSGLQDVCP